MTRVTIDKRKFLVMEKPQDILEHINEASVRGFPIILHTKNGIVSIPQRGYQDFIITAETVKK